jgi:hypothetical protein
MSRVSPVLVLALFAGLLLPAAGSAESPVGHWQVDFTSPDSLSVVPDLFEDCTEVGIPGIVGSACWSFAPDVDPKGDATGSLSVEYDTNVITGTLTATLYGRLRGRSGEPSQPGGVGSTKVKLGMDLSGSLHLVEWGIDAETESSTRCSGTIEHLPDPADLRCKVKVCVAFDAPQLPHAVQECASAETLLTLTPSVVDGDWTLVLDVSDDGSGVLSGTATATFRGQTVDFAVTGKYSPTKDTASLSLKPLTPNGSSIKIKNLTVNGGQITGGAVAYKLFGHRGRTHLAP